MNKNILSTSTWYTILIQVDRALVLSKGREAAGKLLIELQVRKSTADAAGSREFYTELTTPLPGWDGEIRDLVLRKKLVRFTVLSSFFRQLYAITAHRLTSAFPFSHARFSFNPTPSWRTTPSS